MCLDPTTVQLWNGRKWTNVVSFFQPEEKNDVLRLTLRSGEKITCTSKHLWPTARGLLKAGDLNVGDVLDTCQLPPEEGTTSLAATEDVGYFVGLYLAEGSKSKGTIQISGHADEAAGRFDTLSSFAARWGGTCRVHVYGNTSTVNMTGHLLHGFIAEYLDGETSKDKSLSNSVWRESNDFLEGLLRGYLDGDGSWEESANRWRLGFTDNAKLAQSLRSLCARLNKAVCLRRVKHKLSLIHI